LDLRKELVSSAKSVFQHRSGTLVKIEAAATLPAAEPVPAPSSPSLAVAIEPTKVIRFQLRPDPLALGAWQGWPNLVQ
jgi:hypothetical protein